MKQQVTAIKDFQQVLRDMEGWIKNPTILYTGRENNMQLRPREILANWLMCILGNATDANRDFTFSNDPFNNGDGVIFDRKTGEQMVTEHVFVRHVDENKVDAEEMILTAVANKQEKGGKAYAEGKHLVVFCEGIGEWWPNKVGRRLHETHDFSSVWGVGLETAKDNDYKYWIVNFNDKHSPAARVSVNLESYTWDVDFIQ